MKKLMIAAAIVCAAAASQAASITWGFGGKVGLMADAEATSATRGDKAASDLVSKFSGTGLALVYLGQNVSKIDYAEILASTAEDYTGKYKIVDSMSFGVATSGSNANKGKWDPAAKDFTLTDSFSKGATFAVVVFDGAEYGQVKAFTDINTTTGVGTVGDALATPIQTLSEDQLAGLENINAMYVAGSGNGAFAVGNVPEPTSAMLLLLGVAGLALKRKRA